MAAVPPSRAAVPEVVIYKYIPSAPSDTSRYSPSHSGEDESDSDSARAPSVNDIPGFTNYNRRLSAINPRLYPNGVTVAPSTGEGNTGESAGVGVGSSETVRTTRSFRFTSATGGRPNDGSGSGAEEPEAEMPASNNQARVGATGATSASASASVPPPLPPSVENNYRLKCIALKQRIQEVQAVNEGFRIRRARLHRSVLKLRLERAFLLEQLAKRMAERHDSSDEAPSPGGSINGDDNNDDDAQADRGQEQPLGEKGKRGDKAVQGSKPEDKGNVGVDAAITVAAAAVDVKDGK